MQIIVDTREQLPLYFRVCCKRKLIVGDYTTELLESKFHIERKSPQDLYGSIIQGHVRFRKMFVRARVNNIRIAVFVETTRKKFIGKKFDGGSSRKCPGETLDKILSTMSARHNFEIVWCDGRGALMRKLMARLRKEEKLL